MSKWWDGTIMISEIELGEVKLCIAYISLLEMWGGCALPSLKNKKKEIISR
jgi:hypothetical protein